MRHRLPEKFRSPQVWAKLGIAALLCALLRSLAEYFRLKSLEGSDLQLKTVEPFITGSLFTVVGLSVAVGCFFGDKYRWAASVSAITILGLILFKLLLLRAGVEIR